MPSGARSQLERPLNGAGGPAPLPQAVCVPPLARAMAGAYLGLRPCLAVMALIWP